MQLRHIVISVFVIIGMVSCSSTQYISDSLIEIDPAIYKTYMMEDNCADDINPVMQLRIKEALEKNLMSNNYKKDSNADVLIKYFVKNMSKKYVEECREEYTRWEGGRICQERVVNYVEGSIIVDIIDTKTNSIIWHGAAFGSSWSNMKNPNEKVDAVIDKLLNKYFNS